MMLYVTLLIYQQTEAGALIAYHAACSAAANLHVRCIFLQHEQQSIANKQDHMLLAWSVILTSCYYYHNILMGV